MVTFYPGLESHLMCIVYNVSVALCLVSLHVYRGGASRASLRSARSAPGHVVRLSVLCLCMYRGGAPREPRFARLARHLDILFGSL